MRSFVGSAKIDFIQERNSLIQYANATGPSAPSRPCLQFINCILFALMILHGIGLYQFHAIHNAHIIVLLGLHHCSICRMRMRRIVVFALLWIVSYHYPNQHV